MKGMSALGEKNSHLIFHTAVILLYLITSLKCDVEPTFEPLVELYRTRILNSINKCRELHGVPKVIEDEKEKKAVDYIAAKILKKEGIDNIYIPVENEKNKPVGYFPLVSRMQVPEMNDYANEFKYNPIYLWYSGRKEYKGYYDKDTHYKYGFYTQLIWKNSQKVAIGMAYKPLDDGDHEVVIFLAFTPQGNIPDNNEFTQNALSRIRDIPQEVDNNPTHVVPFRAEILSLINRVRELHDVQKLEIDERESDRADSDAAEVLQGNLRDYPEFYIPGRTKQPIDYFELYSRMSVPDIKVWLKELQYNPIFQWYASRKYYPGFYNKDLHFKYGYYTQLIWKNSKKLIIGGSYWMLPNKTYEVVLLLDFWPHGNVLTDFYENVLPARFRIPHSIDPNDVPFMDPYVSYLKGKIFDSIKRVRGLYDLPKIEYNLTYSHVANGLAEAILDGTDKKTFVPGVNEGNPPEGYFPLVNAMVIPDVSYYATERQYNPIYLWFSNRRNCLYHYDKKAHPKCGFFTQLVWKYSIDVAIGIAFTRNSKSAYFVLYLEFYPQGNVNFPQAWSNKVLQPSYPVPADIEPPGLYDK